MGGTHGVLWPYDISRDRAILTLHWIIFCLFWTDDLCPSFFM